MLPLGEKLLVLILLVTPALAQTPSRALTAADLFDDSSLQEIRLTIHPDDWSQLKRDFRDNTYFPANLTWRSVSADDIGIRSRGFGSRNGVKPGLRVDIDRFDDAQEFLGLKSFVLKPNVQDASQMHERLTMLFYDFFGLPAPREAHAKLYVNSQYAGLYTVVESIDKDFLKRVFGEKDGYLYQYEWVGPYRFEYLGSDPARYVPSPFQPQTHERNPDPDVLVSMIRQINEASDGDFASTMSAYLDLKRFMAHLAVETFLAEWDGILAPTGLANFFLYRFEKKNLFQFIVWDKDRTFTDAELPIFRNFNDNVLARRALAVPEARRAFLESLLLCAILAGGQQGWLDYQTNRVYNQIRDPALEDNNKLCPDPSLPTLQPCSNAQFGEGVAKVREFVAVRGEFIRRAVTAAGFQISAGGPRLNQGGVILTAGSLVTLSGDGLAEGEAEATTLPLPASLGGASVFMNGFPAALISASAGQIQMQVPWEVAGENVPVTVVLNGVAGNTVTIDVGQSQPVLYSVTHADGARVTVERPAGAGDALVIRATGLGPVSGAPRTGRAAPAEPLQRTREAPVVSVGGLNAEVLVSGLAPGLVGVYQIEVRVPAGLAAGSATPLVIGAGSQSSAPFPIATR